MDRWVTEEELGRVERRIDDLYLEMEKKVEEATACIKNTLEWRESVNDRFRKLEFFMWTAKNFHEPIVEELKAHVQANHSQAMEVMSKLNSMKKQLEEIAASIHDTLIAPSVEEQQPKEEQPKPKPKAKLRHKWVRNY